MSTNYEGCFYGPHLSTLSSKL